MRNATIKTGRFHIEGIETNASDVWCDWKIWTNPWDPDLHLECEFKDSNDGVIATTGKSFPLKEVHDRPEMVMQYAWKMGLELQSVEMIRLRAANRANSKMYEQYRDGID